MLAPGVTVFNHCEFKRGLEGAFPHCALNSHICFLRLKKAITSQSTVYRMKLEMDIMYFKKDNLKKKIYICIDPRNAVTVLRF